MGRTRVGMVVAGLALAAAGAVVATSQGAGGAGVPTVSVPVAVFNRTEGSSPSTVTITARLSEASATAVSVQFATVAGSAKAKDADYVATKGTLTFPPGALTQTIPVQVNGDTRLEDHEQFKVKLLKPIGATLANFKQTVLVRNDEIPNVVVTSATVNPGQIATFKAKLGKRYFQPLSVTARTVNGSASAPADYAAVNTALTFPADLRTVLKVKVPTMGNVASEATETFSLQAATSVAVLGAATGTITGTGTGSTTTTTTTTTTLPTGGTCPAGSTPTTPQPGAPSSPSTPATLLPPAEVLGGAQWDMIFNDEFNDGTLASAKWGTGMRGGDRTLEGNTELQWYLSANSTVTTDNDGFGNIGVLRQTLKKEPVPGEMYTVRTLSRVYPPSQCPAYYDPNVNNSTSTSNQNPTRTPYQFTSGMVNNSKSGGFKYGYVETRVKLPKGFALWPALWLRDWRAWNYEIDVMENFDRQSRIFRATWWGNGQQAGTNTDGGDVGVNANGTPCREHVPVPATSSNQAFCSLASSIDFSAGYHTIGLNWTATRYELYVDGVKRWTSGSNTQVANTYNHLILNLALGNNVYEFDWVDEPVKPFNPNLFSSSWFPKRTVEWDYVRVWQPAAARNTCAPGTCN